MCTYTGPESGALKGPCTGTAGYLALGEINEIIDSNPDHKRTFDDLSYSDILVYNGTEYVAYMSVDRKRRLSSLYWNFNGEVSLTGLSIWLTCTPNHLRKRLPWNFLSTSSTHWMFLPRPVIEFRAFVLIPMFCKL